MTTKDNPIPPSHYLKTSNGIVEDMLSHDVDIINLFMNFETLNISCFSIYSPKRIDRYK